MEISCEDGFKLYQCHYEQRFFRLELFASLKVRFPRSLQKAVAKRQAEFLAGRYVAKFALAKLGVEVEEIPINNHRAPVWPDGVLGSITHTGNTALCAVAFKSQISFLGIDLENWIRTETASEISSMIVNKVERQLLSQLDLKYSKALSLVFSAKESLFKALYPSVGDYFGFEAVEIVAISVKQKTFELVIVKDLTEKLSVGKKIKGRFDYLDSGIFTCIFG